MLQGGRTPSTAHVISARAAVAALSCSHAGVVVIDARNPALVALDRVAGAIAFEGGSVPSLQGRTALVYDAGSSSLCPPYSRAADVVFALLDSHPYDARVCLVSGGLPALRETAPRLVVCAPRSADEVDRLRAKLAAMKNAPKWARAALESLIDAAKPAAAVLPWLHVGSDHDARSLPTMLARGYTHVLAVGEELRCNFPASFEYFLVSALDVSSYRLISHFSAITLFLRDVRARADAGENVRVLVHCFAGMSRSVAAVAAFLAAEGVPVKTALRHIASRRIGAAPNHGFLTQLSEWEAQLSSSIPPVGPPLRANLKLPLCSLPSAIQTRRPSELEREILNECRQEPDEMELDSGSMSPMTPAARGLETSSDSTSENSATDANTNDWVNALSQNEGNDPKSSPTKKFGITKLGFEGGLSICASVLKKSCSPALTPVTPFELINSTGEDSRDMEVLSDNSAER